MNVDFGKLQNMEQGLTSFPIRIPGIKKMEEMN
jgi:hypothetical protein